MAKQKYYFTFGSGQKHENGYHVIEAESANEARVVMNGRFDKKWAFLYESAKAAGVEAFNLHEVIYVPLFDVSMYEDGTPVSILSAELRTLEAAIHYALDCTKMLVNPVVGKVDTPPDVTVVIKDPARKVVWRISAERIDIHDSRAQLMTKMLSLTPEELEHIEFTIDAFIKRREI